MKKQQLQAIFFDFDGVIIDSNSIKAEAFRILFADYNETIAEEVVSYHQLHGGVSRVEKIRYAHQCIIKKPLQDSQVEQWAQRYSQLVMDKVIEAQWIKGAEKTLDTSLGKLLIFVISGTPEAELREIIRCRNIAYYFNAIHGSPVKKPAHISKLLSEYQLVPDQCVFVGDAMADFDAAEKTGLKFIGIQSEVNFPNGTTVLPDCMGLIGAIAKLFC